jgi:diguanylate cyclase (GGDEF)-like protein
VRNHAAVVIAVLVTLAFLGWRLETATRSTRMQALHDTLTGLANRRCLNDAIEGEFRRAARKGESLSFVMADIDLFKNFNDTYGHQAGDDCLRAVASAIEGVLGRAGDMAARYGGEEIAVLIPDTDVAGATRIAERMQAAVSALAIPHHNSPYGIVTISAGVASCVPNPVSSWKPLVRAADEALYVAKAAGRNTFRISGG